jgi:hypothetical protein
VASCLHQAQQYFWSGIALKRFGAQRYIWPLPLAASPACAASCLQQAQNKFQIQELLSSGLERSDKTKEKGQLISADLWKLLCAKVTF